MKLRLLNAIAILASAASLSAQEQPAPRLEKVTPRVSAIFAGFNGIITVFASENGPVIVDSADAASAPAVQALIRSVDPRPPVAVILTHYHDDHSAGLPTLAAGATLHAQEACLATLQKKARLAETIRLAPYTKSEQLQFGADTVSLIHPGSAHTGGDTLVVFGKEKVIVGGDLAFIGLPPYIDVADGADTANWADTIERMAKEHAGFKLIPGHGPVTDTDGWLGLAKYLRALRKGVEAAVAAGQTREQAQASVKLDGFAGVQDVSDFLTKKANVGWVYDELTRKR